MKNQQLAIEYGHENSYSFRNHNSRRRELWNLQSRESSPTQTAVLSGRAALYSAHDLPSEVTA